MHGVTYEGGKTFQQEAEREEDWSALEADNSLLVLGRRHAARRVQGLLSPTLSWACTHRGLFPIEDLIWWVSEGDQSKQKGSGATGGVV